MRRGRHPVVFQVNRSENLGTLTMYGGHGLGVYCRACHHRAVVDQKTLGAHSGNMKTLQSIRLRCKGCDVRGTGKAEFVLLIFHDSRETGDFLLGKEHLTFNAAEI